jgi:hypothetical protein
MDSKVLLGRIIQKMIDIGYCQVKPLNRFEYISHTDTYIMIVRERGKNTRIYYNKIVEVIDKYKENPEDYSLKPSKLRDYGLTHVTSPIWSLLHLLDKRDYS